ncbi:MAG TPA: response regulator [Gemmatimonadaceae bacterium]|nr:response regulator [Gemmatimonadaceae bacterium]
MNSSSSEALLVLDAQLVVRAANKAFYEIFKLAPEESVGKRVYEIGGKAWDQKLREMLESVLAGLPQSDHFELLHDEQEAGHGVLWLSARLLPSSDPADATVLLSIESLATAATAEEALTARTEELNSLAELAGRSAHELNNLLTVIRMNADLVRSTLTQNNLAAHEMDDIFAASQRAEELTKTLLVTSRRARPQPTGLDRRDAPLPLPGSPLRETIGDMHEREHSFNEANEIRPLREDVPPGSETILLVEDEKALRKVQIRILSDAGYRVLEASDGAHALRVAAEEVGEIDLVVTDIEMPTLGGRGMVDELHELSPGMRVLFMSGYTDNDILRRGINTSTTNFLRKPFTGETLLAAVRSVLQKPATTTAR